jgi:peptide deformylase
MDPNVSVMPITMLGRDAILRRTAAAVPQGQDIRALAHDMRVSMRAHDGIGIAAPQVGKDLRMFLVAKELFPPEIQAQLSTDIFLNPKLKKRGFKREVLEEGCLSVPDVYGEVSRAMHVTLEAYNQDWKPLTITTTGLLARVFQHEVDHLNGTLFVDHANKKTLHKLLDAENWRPWSIEEVEPGI